MTNTIISVLAGAITSYLIYIFQFNSNYKNRHLDNVFQKIHSSIEWLERQLNYDDVKGTRNKYLETEIFSRVRILQNEVTHYYNDIRRQEDESISCILTRILDIDLSRSNSSHNVYIENLIYATELLYQLEEQLRKDMKLSSSCRPVLTGVTAGSIIMIVYLFIINYNY